MTRVPFIVSSLIVLATANPASAGADNLRQHPVAKFSVAESDRWSDWEGLRRCRHIWGGGRQARVWCTRSNIRG
jgi:hypothetical protein